MNINELKSKNLKELVQIGGLCHARGEIVGFGH